MNHLTYEELDLIAAALQEYGRNHKGRTAEANDVADKIVKMQADEVSNENGDEGIEGA